MNSLDACSRIYMEVAELFDGVQELNVSDEDREETYGDPKDYYMYDGDDEELKEAYLGASSSLRKGNRRWRDNGYIGADRQEAQPILRPSVSKFVAASSSRMPTKQMLPKIKHRLTR